MSSPIPSKSRTLSFNSPDHSGHASPQLLTPTGTPPPIHTDAHHAAEFRLRQLLANFDAGTHSICREERESPAERKMTYGEIDPKQGSARRPSFLSSLSLSRPFNFHASPSSPDFASGAHSRPKLDEGVHANIQSSPDLSQLDVARGQSEGQPTQSSPAIGRSKSSAQIPVKQKGFDLSHLTSKEQIPLAQRHFDPSKEPRLFGLI